MLTNEREQQTSEATATLPALSSRAPPAAEQGFRNVFMESWLDKKAEWRFTWDRRFVTLVGNRMAYRVEEDGPEKRCGTVVSLDCNTDKSELVFRVWLLEGSSWTLRAPDLSVYERWLEALLTSLQPTSADAVNGDIWAAGEPSSVQPLRTPSEHPASNNAIVEGQGHATSTTSSTLATPTPAPTGRTGDPWGPVLLVAHVEKQAAWTGRWKKRVIELYESHQLAYRATETSAVRQRYTVIAVDLAVRTAALATSRNSALTGQVDCLMLVSTSVGERFWVQFPTREVCREWYSTLYSSLQRQCPWQWIPLPEDLHATVPLLPDSVSRAVVPATNLVLDGVGTHVYDNLRAHYHCATVAPLSTFSSGGAGRGGMGSCLYVYGGSNRTCRNLFQPGAKAFVPSADRHCVLNTLSALQLFGSHATQTLTLLPYEEKPHVKVRPPPLLGATMSAIYKSDTGVQLNRTSFSAVQVVLVGGVTGDTSLSGLTRSDVWSATLSPPAHLLADGTSTTPVPSFQPLWRKTTFPVYEFPSLAFHAATNVSDVVAKACPRQGQQGAPAADETAAFSTIFVTGGLDTDLRARGECYLLRWPYDEATEQVPATPTVSFFGFLPEPRAFHGMGTLSNGTVVLVGGRGVSNADVTPVLTLPLRAIQEYMDVSRAALHRSEECDFTAGKKDSIADPDEPASPWLRVQWHRDQWALPPMPDVTVAVTEAGDRVVALSQLTNPRMQVKLFVLSFQEIAENTGGGEKLPPFTMRVRWDEIALRVGAIPKSVCGTSIHIYNGYIYVIGAWENGEGMLIDGTPITTAGNQEDSERLAGPLRILLPAP